MKKSGKLLLCLVALLPFSMLHVKAEHVHSWSDWEVITEASCGSDGYESRYCTRCFTEEEKVIPATGEHDWDEWLVYKSPSCFKTGEKSRYCNNCNAREQEEIPAYGAHKWSAWIITKNSDCLNSGEKYRYCEVCYESETQKIPSNANAHNYSSWRTIRKSTAFKKGYIQRECFICRHVQKKYLPLLKTAVIKTTSEKQVKKTLDNFFLAARNYNSAKMKKYLWSSSKVWTFSDKGTSSLWRKYTKAYLKFAVKSMSVKGKKATVKVYCQYLDGTNAFYKALNKASSYYLNHINASNDVMDQVFMKYRQQYLRSENRTINNTSFTLYLTKKGKTWKINSFTSSLDNVINGNYTKFVNAVN